MDGHSPAGGPNLDQATPPNPLALAPLFLSKRRDILIRRGTRCLSRQADNSQNCTVQKLSGPERTPQDHPSLTKEETLQGEQTWVQLDSSHPMPRADPACVSKGREWSILVCESCPTPSDLMDCSPPGSSSHGILQARILEWVAISFSRILV